MNTSKCRAITEQFIAIYKSVPCLWQVKNKDYHNRDKRTIGYRRLIAKLRELDPDADREAVVRKINSLRTNYRKEKRKVEESRLSGTDIVYEPTLWYYDLLTFVDDQEIPTEETEWLEECYVENPTLHESTEDLSVDNDESLRSTTSPARRKKRKAKRRYSVDAPDPEPVFYDIQEDIQDNQQYKSEDRYDVFGKIVAMKLRDLPKTQRLLAEKVINETLFEAEMGILAPRMVSTYSSAQTTDMCRPSSSSRQDAPCIRIEMDELPVKKKEKM